MNSDGGKGLGRPLDEDDGQNHKKDTETGESPRQADKGYASAAGDTITRDRRGNEPANQTRERESVVHSATLQGAGRAVSVSTWLLFAVNLGTLVVTAFQLISMNGQLAQMMASNVQLEKSINAANRQADAAEKANKLTAESLSSSDRAWLYFSPSVISKLSTSNDFEFRLVLKNSGKTPGMQVNYQINMANDDVNGKHMPPAERKIGRAVGPIFQDSRGYEFFSVKKEFVTETMLDDIRKKTANITIRTEISYVDVNNRPHHTKSCFYYDIVVGEFTSCATDQPNFAD